MPFFLLPIALIICFIVSAFVNREEIFGEIRKKLKSAKYDQRLPEGIILTGGGARMRDIELFAKKALEA